MSEKAKRFNSGKLDFDDFPLIGFIEAVKVSRIGEAKYDKYNWKRGGPASQYINAMFRHLLKIILGQTIDPEIKTFHAGCISWNACALIETLFMGTGEFDIHVYPNMTEEKIEELFSLNEDQKAVIKEFKEKKEQKQSPPPEIELIPFTEFPKEDLKEGLKVIMSDGGGGQNKIEYVCDDYVNLVSPVEGIYFTFDTATGKHKSREVDVCIKYVIKESSNE